eukprot:CAMPEP_0201569964 /NCGR_PEP_ID=MMETSP0190_2-20130828/11964_1 /ASSEMBLY_ACC=CAM_ASM_000263 /TAXON_ID=37353 /ORGANISM="Rosalina sp." /LENGTH=338 /DNA_ID=CAMNT_0047992951 /DNA_START=30 /DNA_END=1047 /DNA_ORIENTATION=+
MATEINEMENLTLTKDVGECQDSDDEAIEIRVITKDTKPKWIPYILICVMCMVVTAIIIAVATTINETRENSPDDIDYVLPNATVAIILNTDTFIAGDFVVDGMHYEFKSISNQTAQFIEFSRTNQDAVTGFIAFKLNHLHDSQLLFELYHVENNEIQISFIKFSKGVQISSENKTELDTFMQDIICEHFVELSVKLGSLNHTGPESPAIGDLHGFAQWIWQYESDMTTFKRDWVDLEYEFEKVNELILYSSGDKSVKLNGGHRSLLAGCTIQNSVVCDNDVLESVVKDVLVGHGFVVIVNVGLDVSSMIEYVVKMDGLIIVVLTHSGLNVMDLDHAE